MLSSTVSDAARTEPRPHTAHERPAVESGRARLHPSRSVQFSLCALLISGCSYAESVPEGGSVGDWKEPRQNPHLTAIQPMAGAMTEPPQIFGRVKVSPGRPRMTPVASHNGEETLGLCVVGGALYCYDTMGSLKWRSHPLGLNFTTIITIEDLDGDGRMEIALQAGRPASPYSAAVLVSLDDGRVVWRYDVEPMSYAWYLHVDDFLPDDESKQIIVLMHGYPPDKDNGYIVLFDFKMPGEPPEPVWRYDFHEYTCFPPLLRTDLDGDGVDELAVVTHSRMWLLDAPTGEMKQFVKWDVSPGNVRSYGLDKFVDLNGDGREDFLCIADFAQHHEVLLNVDGRLQQAWHYGWAESVTTGKVVTTWPEPPYADIDGDGQMEIVVSMYNSEDEQAWLIRVYDAVTGELEYRMPGSIAAAIADVDGDGAAEIGANSSSDPTKTKFDGAQLLRVVNGTLHAVWEDPTGKFLSSGGHVAQTRHTQDSGAGRGSLTITRAGETFDFVYGDGVSPQLEVDSRLKPPAGPNFTAVPPIEGSLFPTLLAADLSGDGQNELLVYAPPQMRVLQFDRDWNASEVLRADSDGLPGLADLDGDGHLEVITGRVSEHSTPVVEARTPALSNRLLWRSVYPDTGRKGLPWRSRKYYVRTGHFTGKGTPDLYVWTGVPFVRSCVLDGRSGEIIWERVQASQERYWGPSHNLMTVYDSNADGKEDLVFTNPDQYCVCDGPTGEFLVGPSSPTKIFQQPSMGLYTMPAILEAETDNPTVCLIAGHYFQAAMGLSETPLWYQAPLAGDNRSGPEGFLKTRDGSWLMGFGRQNGRFACLNALDGTVRWEVDLQASCSEVCTLDVDGDGRQEFVVGTSHHRLYAIGDDDGQPREVWQVELPAGAGLRGLTYPAGTAAPIAADMNQDGKSEILVPLNDGYVYVLGRTGK